MRQKKLFITIGLIAVSVVIAVISWFILPEMVAVQITVSGVAGNTVPKIFGILLPFIISTAFSISFYINEDKKHLVYAVMGIIIAVVFITFNKVHY